MKKLFLMGRSEAGKTSLKQVLDGAHERRELSDTDYAVAKDVLALRYCLEKSSILR